MNSGCNTVSVISVQASELSANWGLLMAPQGVRLMGKWEKGWRWGTDMTVAKTGVTTALL